MDRPLLIALVLLGLSLRVARCARPCKAMGTVTLQQGLAAMPTCLEFYDPPAAPIKVSADTAYTKFGTMQADFMGNRVLVDRAGKSWPIANSTRKPLPLNATALESLQRSGQAYGIIAVGSLDSKAVVHSVRLVAYIPFATMLSPFKNTTFIGSVASLAAPTGTPTAAFARWDFGSSITSTGPIKVDTKLHGSFTSLRNNTMQGGRCEKSLCATAAACAFYSKTFGNSSALTLYYDPAMHNALDSELVSKHGVCAAGAASCTAPRRPSALHAGRAAACSRPTAAAPLHHACRCPASPAGSAT